MSKPTITYIKETYSSVTRTECLEACFEDRKPAHIFMTKTRFWYGPRVGMYFFIRHAGKTYDVSSEVTNLYLTEAKDDDEFDRRSLIIKQYAEVPHVR